MPTTTGGKLTSWSWENQWPQMAVKPGHPTHVQYRAQVVTRRRRERHESYRGSSANDKVQNAKPQPATGRQRRPNMTASSPPDRTFRVLAVCTANICRSPMAEYLLRQEFARSSAAGNRIEVASAGTRGFNHALMDLSAAEQLRALGPNPEQFRSRPLTDLLCEQADLIVTATRGHRSQVLERNPQALRRTFTLLEFAEAIAIVRKEKADVADLSEAVRLAAVARSRVTLQGSEYDVADPYGESAERHRHAAETIRTAALSIAVGLLPAGRR